MTSGKMTAQIAVAIETFIKYTSAHTHTQPDKIWTEKTQRFISFFSTRKRKMKVLGKLHLVPQVRINQNLEALLTDVRRVVLHV